VIDAFRVKNIVVPTDFSASARKALEVARDVASAAGPAHLTLVHAYSPPVDIEALAPAMVDDYLKRLSDRATEELAKALDTVEKAGISTEYFALRGNPSTVVTELAEEKNADLIVMGTHGRTGIARAALGSVAERVVRTARCPVLTVRPD
jgi:nucleotide-binding universal stress UspA family protein